ncbi:hypothetical protein LMG23992_00164 [Cupriavidus laharis]|uniref:Uncharacterized protein n=1 Tax=Cupriavidus laharis TaxID=151654 RepID=A0ABM8WCI3_9BURK|nr:hypothetical protein LMG23992_00164 [Cupriavidus laharis]
MAVRIAKNACTSVGLVIRPIVLTLGVEKKETQNAS